jgi:hypothetical protein
VVLPRGVPHVVLGAVDAIGASEVHARAAPRASTHVALRIRATDSTPSCGNLDPDRMVVAHYAQVG